jgi:hypothetical protein
MNTTHPILDWRQTTAAVTALKVVGGCSTFRHAINKGYLVLAGLDRESLHQLLVALQTAALRDERIFIYNNPNIGLFAVV